MNIIPIVAELANATSVGKIQIMNNEKIPVICGCGEEAHIAIHFTNYDHKGWCPLCLKHYHEHLENSDDTNRCEMERFGGAYGLVTWEEHDIENAIQDRPGGYVHWINEGDVK